MSCHVVITRNATDSAVEVLRSTGNVLGGQDTVLHVPLRGALGRGIDTNVAQQLTAKGLVPPDAAVEFFVLAAAVYVADKRVLRRHSPDRWTRSFQLYLPASDPDRWKPLLPRLEAALRFLTGDYWTIKLRQERVTLPSVSTEHQLRQKVDADCICLFSGGLDSCIGAIDLLATGRRPLLVGHYDDGQTPGYQSRVHSHLVREYGDDRCPLLQVRVRPEATGRGIYEKTTRSRSMLFVSLGVMAAASLGPGTTVFVPENGPISLNVPLIPPRLGSLSTRTTHPYYMRLLSDIIAGIGLNVPLVNPYQFRTKGEMLRECRDQGLIRKIAAETMSCSHPALGRWERLSNKHCGYCLPCLIRRGAMHFAGMDDPEHYHRDVLTDELPPNRRGATLRALHMALLKARTGITISDILKSGPLGGLGDGGDLHRYLDTYRRGMRELAALLAPGVDL